MTKSDKNNSKDGTNFALGTSKRAKTFKNEAARENSNRGENNQPHTIWSINSVISSIFTYADNKDLIEFNTVCKRWNHLTNRIIHKSIKLLRSQSIQNKIYSKNSNKFGKIDAEVVECIINNAKHAPLVKELKYCEKLELTRSIEFFKTFNYLTKLYIGRVEILQEQLLGMLKPLRVLEELELQVITIKQLTRNSKNIKPVQLPSTLTKLTLHNIAMVNNPELFIQTINSHNNLIELNFRTNNLDCFLEPVCKFYPSLKTFRYRNPQLLDPSKLFNVFEFNPQLLSLKLELNFFDDSLTSHISQHLISLEEFNMFQYPLCRRANLAHCIKFSNFTKIKKIILNSAIISSISLESILLNCPQLEELNLMLCRSYLPGNNPLSNNLSNPAKIKKLSIACDYLSKSLFNYILLSCSELKELEIQLPRNWKDWMTSIGESCINLEKLKIWPTTGLSKLDQELFYQELHELEFLTTNSAYKSTLTHLNLSKSNFYSSNPQHFTNFKNLKFIRFPLQKRKFNQNNNIESNLWEGYKLVVNNFDKYWIDIELIKL